jgi:hypothetical protein
VLVGVLVGAAGNLERVVVVEDVKIRACFRPEVVGFGRMDVRIVSAGGGQNVVVGRSVGDMLADVLDAAIKEGKRRPVHKTIDERGVWVLKDLLNPAGDAGGLSPVVIFQCDYENVFDFL